MKRFCIKFFLLFFLIDGFIGLYHFGIRPNLTGDMGKIGQIPFGQEYTKRMQTVYKHERRMVQDITPADTITAPVITLGDSFSKQGENGYSQFLAELLGNDVQNIRYKQPPEQTLIQLLNQHKIPQQTTVLVEVVERSLTWRMNYINYQDSTKAFSIDNKKDALNKKDLENQRTLQGAIQFLKKSAGIQQPISRYSTTQELFMHTKFHKRLYIYDSPWDKDGDLRFTTLTEEDIANAYKNMEVLHQLAENHGIRLFFLIAADKYDVYEPFITSSHPKNPTLDFCPDEYWIINTKPLLQAQAYAGCKDIYYINDTHWSPIGAKIVAEEIFKRLQR